MCLRPIIHSSRRSPRSPISIARDNPRRADSHEHHHPDADPGRKPADPARRTRSHRPVADRLRQDPRLRHSRRRVVDPAHPGRPGPRPDPDPRARGPGRRRAPGPRRGHRHRACSSTAAARWVRRRTRFAAAPRSSSARPVASLDHLRPGRLRLDDVRFLVLDEADEMLDRGFAPAGRRRSWPGRRATRQTALFSATMPEWVSDAAHKHLRNRRARRDRCRRRPRRRQIDHIAYDVAEPAARWTRSRSCSTTAATVR